MNRTSFYILRHGETILNYLGKAQGWCDSPLTQKGSDSAYQAAQKLSGISIDKAFCSDTIRAKQTARIVLDALPCPSQERPLLTQDKRLREWCLGIFEGADNKEFMLEIQQELKVSADLSVLNSRLPEIAHIIYKKDTTHMAETYTKITERLFDFFKSETQAVHGKKNILVVSHALLIKTILYELAPEMLENIKEISNTHMLRVDYCNGKFNIKN